MIKDSCPIPNKKQRTLDSPGNSDGEELNLSKAFDDDYRVLMDEEILTICEQADLLNENLEHSEFFHSFLNRCDEFFQCMNRSMNKKRKFQCRCDIYLEKFDKICHIRELFESPKFMNIKFLANLLITKQPHLTPEVENKLSELKKMWDTKYLDLKIDLSVAVKDINGDINDLKTWLNEVDSKLNYLIDKQKHECIQSVQNILNDFKIHDDIKNSVSKTIEKIIQMDSNNLHDQQIFEYKTNLNDLICSIYVQWLKVMELKCKLEGPISEVCKQNPWKNFGISVIGQESGFESEISPMNPTRGLSVSNLRIMKYISSSGECLLDGNTTDLPMDSESVELSENISHDKNDSFSSSSLIDTVQELSSKYVRMVNESLNVRKKQKRLRKRRRLISKSLEPNGEKENSISMSNSFSNQSHSTKRRISDTNIVETKDTADETACRISDLASAAEKIVMKNEMIHRHDSLSESPKESELDDGYNIIISSGNDLSVNEVWDNYQASLYSNDDDDSQIVDIDKIRDWEQDPEIDDQEFETNCNFGKILTSGYETSLESDSHLCNKNLLNILKFSISQHTDVTHRFDSVAKQSLDKTNIFTNIKMNASVNEQISISKTHIKLLDQILNNDSCGLKQNEILLKQTKVLQEDWKNLVKKLMSIASKYRTMVNVTEIEQITEEINRIQQKLSSVNSYIDLVDLESKIQSLKGSDRKLTSIESKIININYDHKQPLILNSIIDRSKILKTQIYKTLEKYQNDLQIIQHCMEKLHQCQRLRELINSEFGFVRSFRNSNGEWQSLSNNALNLLSNNQIKLENCLDDLEELSSENCRENMKINLETEIHSLYELTVTFSLPLNENLQSKMEPVINKKSAERIGLGSISGFLNHLPLKIAIFVLIAICGVWYKNQPSNSCQNSADWFRLFKKCTNNIEPH